MNVAILQRQYRMYRPTISVLSFDTQKVFVLELPYRDNKKQISCIPEGEYICSWVKSPKFGWTYQVFDVPARNNILIHAGNSATETYGCLLPGISTDLDLHVWNSRAALNKIHAAFKRENFKLIIRK
jgi:hypothetical protein